jgi:hypothetical protein
MLKRRLPSSNSSIYEQQKNALAMHCKLFHSLTFRAWRSGGFLAQKFKGRTALEPTTKLSYEALHPPLFYVPFFCRPFNLVVKMK